MLFSQISLIFEELESERSRTKITEKLAFIFSSCSAEEASLLSYLMLGSLLPPYKNNNWNLAEKSLFSIISLLCNQNIELIKTLFKAEGDLGSVALKLLTLTKHAPSEDPSVLTIHKTLTELAQISGTGSQEQKEKMLSAYLIALDPHSIKYIIRIINGDLRLGFSDMTLLDAFSWSIVHSKELKKQLERAYNICADIGLIIYTLKTTGIAGIGQLKATPGIPIRPAAAERLNNSEDIIKKIGSCIAQPKLDGLRLQVHIFTENNQRRVAIFSRNLKEMSQMFPELSEQALHLTTQDCIVEGEALAYDVKTEKMLPFQVTATRRRKHNVAINAADTPLKLFLFDMLYLNDQDLLAKTHHERRKLLSSLINQAQEKNQISSIILIEEKLITSAEELADYFEECIADGFEGLITKKTDAHYQPGTRNFNWIKLKRQERGSLNDTLDCVIFGYYYGQGKRAQFGIGAFLVGIYNKTNETFETIAKIGTGLFDKEWISLKELCDKHKVDHQPASIICPKELTPDLWIEPSIVCSIRADEITQSPLHTAGKTASSPGYALRFPRIIDYRPDKSATDATTSEEVISFYKNQTQKSKLLGL
jgi:DNA ligase-1